MHLVGNGVESMIRLFLCLMVLATQIGCLGFFEEPQALESKPNNPPWIDETSMDPSNAYVDIDKTTDPTGTTTFSLKRALDFDGGDTLYGYWLLGRKVGADNILRCGSRQAPLPQNFNPFELRAVNFTCSIGHARSELISGKEIVLELYVLDREVPFEDVNKPEPGWPRDGNHFTSVKWILQVR